MTAAPSVPSASVGPARAARSQALLGWTVGAWAVGVQLTEGLAAAGMVATLLVVLTDAGLRSQLLSKERLRREWPLIAFVAWGLLAPTLALHPPTGAGAARLLDWVFLPVAAVACAALAEQSRVRMSTAVGIAALASCAAALCQHFGVWPSPERFQHLGWTHIPFYRMYEPITGAPGRFMAGGLLWHRLKFAHVESLVALTAAAVALGGRGRRRVLALSGCAVVFASVLLFPYARAAVVALSASLALLLVLAWPDRRRAVLVSGGVLVLALLAVLLTPSLRQRFSTSNTDEGSGDRYAFRAAALRAVAAHPLVGVGAGRFRPSLFADPSTPENVLQHPGKAHLQWLSLAAELGIPGALLFTVLMVQLWWRMRRRVAAAALGRAAIAFFVLLSLLHDPLFHAEVSMALVLTLGCAVGLAERDPVSGAAIHTTDE